MSKTQTIGERLKYARSKAGMTQEDLAHSANIRQGDISKLETDAIKTSTKLIQMARAIGCNAVWLATGEGSPFDHAAPDSGPRQMTKSNAIKLLGGSQTAAAQEIGVKPQAIRGWPEVLSQKIEDRVLAALWRRQNKTQPAALASDADTTERRDQFAMAAMQGMVAAEFPSTEGPSAYKFWAEQAYEMADAMLKARA